MEQAPPIPRVRAFAVILSVIAAALFIALCSVNLTAQGLHYDEVHQAPAAFAWLGRTPDMFNPLPMGNVPLLNISYSGAIKSHLYGAYLRFVSPHFTVRSWRMLGIGLAAAGLLIFGLIAGPAMPSGSLILFLLMIVTDATVILTSRHDWGPTALALLLRLVFVGVWVNRETGDGGIARRNAIMGALVGITIYEKLSSAVMLPVLLIVSLISVRPMSRRDRLASLIGLAAGLLPLLVVNIWSLASGRGLISLASVSGHQSGITAVDAARYAFRWLSLGQGRVVSHWILGSPSSGRMLATFEALLLLAMLIGVPVLWRRRRGNPHLRMASVMVACYVAVALGVFLLPRTTGAHHWILGTPFQYAAVAFLTAGITSPSTTGPRGRPASR